MNVLRNKPLTFKPLLLSCIIALTLSGCANTKQQIHVKKSFLHGERSSTELSDSTEPDRVENNNSISSNKSEQIKPFQFKKNVDSYQASGMAQFSDDQKVKLAADELPLNEFLHYVLGELLSVSYILGDDIKADDASLTLNLQESVTHKKLFSLVEEMLTERGYVVRYSDNIFYINKEQSGARKNVVWGYGNQVEDIPNTTQDIWQLAPFRYDFKGTLQMTLGQLAKVQVFPDSQQNLLLLKGKRGEIAKALSFMALVDKPVFSSREIAIYRSDFVDTKALVAGIEKLLLQEGVRVGKDTDINQALSIVSLDSIGAIALFANEPEVIARATMWAKQLDKPAQGDELQYFLYAPRFSRASDLGESLAGLIGGSTNVGSSTSAAKESNKATTTNSTAQTNIKVGSAGGALENMSLVVDERANSLIFYSTADEYRKLLPLIKRLDVLPKQIMLEVIIAEVTLTDEFKAGVEFALTDGNYTTSTNGALGRDKLGGLGYTLTGALGEIKANLFEGNSLVNVLSRPSVVVRDGVSANISVGTDIPIIGETTEDPVNGDRQTTKVEYRKTGVQLEVIPTINAQGVVIMEIKQKISNQVEAGSTVVSSPSIFERTLNTEVIAESGETIILGGLISESKTNSDSRVPFFADIPILGKLFEAQKQDDTKTELVMLVTPKIIESNEQWLHIKAELSQGLDNLKPFN
ncbi:general secretion pathway protein GspD [Pseudoalteromonas citrea]|uniref:General secretion pathway protein GspD n=1 Tax=Pseudoalteromonas citrea TaxID=43655 RepID=A0A5S3XP89_9GAMM|nr:secretin N-terminal domain-containing protein [Pseudoalteromonas citrea]TMP45689.1 general secretion pathway protein GspD [Pseudoalteromonas citrea]TMP59068.1 general secretion pathway protein GspD [Pseudoalteromonas citrea]